MKLSSAIRRILYIFAWALIIALSIFLCFRFSLPRSFDGFYGKAKRHFEVPGLDEEFVPQGLDYVSERGKFIISGYEGDEEKSVIYVCEADSYKKVNITKDSGEFFCHSGGICAWGDFVYMAGCDGYCYIISCEELFDQDGTAKVMGAFYVGNNANFLSAHGGKLYVGEYYFPLFFPTEEHHHLKTPCGDMNRALMVTFSLIDDGILGVNPTPREIYSIRDSVQGISITDDSKILMSSSNSINGAFLTSYDLSSARLSGDTLSFLGHELPIYYLDDSSMISTMEILPNSEGITFYGGRVYMVFESASYKFPYGKWLDSQYIYSIGL